MSRDCGCAPELPSGMHWPDERGRPQREPGCTSRSPKVAPAGMIGHIRVGPYVKRKKR